jgi:DNA-binding CsgD family transcriptional regulator
MNRSDFSKASNPAALEAFLSSLSPGQRAVAELLMEGKTTAEIARARDISQSRVRQLRTLLASKAGRAINEAAFKEFAAEVRPSNP